MTMNKPRHLLVLPRLRVQNANAISSPLTWGFPAMSGFVGFMHALERRLSDAHYLEFHQVGVVCHRHEILASPNSYNEKQFHLTRNPIHKASLINRDGSLTSPAIPDDGRMHLDISLIFAVSGDNCALDEAARAELARDIHEEVCGMRLAGGSVFGAQTGHKNDEPRLVSLPDNADEYEKAFRRLRRCLLPGFALVLNEKALTDRQTDLHARGAASDRLNAWLDFARLHRDCRIDSENDIHRWEIRSSPGWQVPIPIGYGALGDLHEPGEVANTRDTTTPFRFVESLYSIGQWVSPHRLNRPEALLWYVDNDVTRGIYRLNNDYTNHAISSGDHHG